MDCFGYKGGHGVHECMFIEAFKRRAGLGYICYCLKSIFHEKHIYGLQKFTLPFQQQTRNAIHYNILCNLYLVGSFIFLVLVWFLTG